MSHSFGNVGAVEEKTILNMTSVVGMQRVEKQYRYLKAIIKDI